jgi:Cu2+-containing amine oxidase
LGKLPRCYTKVDTKTSGKPGDWDVPGPGSRPRPGSAEKPPIQSCSRHRFSLGADSGGGNNGRLVSWLDWTFFVTVRPSTGLAVMDMRFQGKRVAHEVALSEAVAYYSGSGGDQVMYLDSAYSMRQLSAALIPGVDCPSDAAYINSTMWVHQEDPDKSGEAAQLLRSDPRKARPVKAACVFERDRAEGLWRHTEVQAKGKLSHGVRATSLVVRMVTTVSNYDYLTEFEFSPDGSVKASITFAGYCETRWYAKHVNPWETMLSEIAHSNMAAPLHSHLATFKVDLDVLGESNSFETTSFKVGRPKGVPGLEAYPTKYVERSVVPNEGVGVSTARPGASMWRIINPDPDAKIGDASAPGYTIRLMATASQDLPADHPMVVSTPFSKYNIAVTKRHESEQRVSSIYDLWGQLSPPYLNFDDFLADGESIQGADLVAWVTVGKEHLPRTEDMPVVTNFGTGFSLLPWNIFPTNAGMDMATAAGQHGGHDL